MLVRELFKETLNETALYRKLLFRLTDLFPFLRCVPIVGSLWSLYFCHQKEDASSETSQTNTAVSLFSLFPQAASDFFLMNWDEWKWSSSSSRQSKGSCSCCTKAETSGVVSGALIKEVSITWGNYWPLYNSFCELLNRKRHFTTFA